MKGFTSFLLAIASSSTMVGAHTVFTTLFVNDVSQGDGTCVRMNMDPQACTDPLEQVDSDDMACGRRLSSWSLIMMFELTLTKG